MTCSFIQKYIHTHLQYHLHNLVLGCMCFEFSTIATDIMAQCVSSSSPAMDLCTNIGQFFFHGYLTNSVISMSKRAVCVTNTRPSRTSMKYAPYPQIKNKAELIENEKTIAWWKLVGTILIQYSSDILNRSGSDLGRQCTRRLYQTSIKMVSLHGWLIWWSHYNYRGTKWCVCYFI